MERRLAIIRTSFFAAIFALSLFMAGSNEAVGIYKGYEGPELPDEQISILDWSGRNAPDVSEIDGKRVSPNGTTSRTGPSHKRAKLLPGLHRIVLQDVERVRRTGVTAPVPFSRFPMTLNARAGRTYMVKQAWHDFGWGYEVNNIWIEDAASGEVVAGQSPPSEEYSQPRSTVQIAQWRSLCRNAVKGDGSARSGIGSHYRHGWEPVQENLVLAFKWYSLAVNAGYHDAASYRDEVAAQMSPEQLAEGRQLIAEWVPDAMLCEAEGLASSVMQEGN